jgi:hypothetical protein
VYECTAGIDSLAGGVSGTGVPELLRHPAVAAGVSHPIECMSDALMSST